MPDHIYIIGAGAIGKALAVFLQNSGKDVTLLRARDDGSSVQTLSISVELNAGITMESPVRVSSVSRQSRLDGIVVMTNKSIGNNAIATELRDKVRASPVVLLQNGLNIEQPLLDMGVANLYRCVLFATSQQMADNTVRFKPVSPSPIGLIKGDASLLGQIASSLNCPQFPFVPEANIQPIIWKKVIANCVFNSICPLLDTDNGIFHRDPVAMALASEVVFECVLVANAAGVTLVEGEVLQTILQISRASNGQLISTLQDIRNRRPTEIESLNFAVVEIAHKLGKEDSVQRTKVLGELTKLKSELSMNGVPMT